MRCIDPARKDSSAEYCVPIGRMFGRNSDQQPRVQVMSDQENVGRLNTSIASAQHSIKAVTLNGKSYLSAEQEDALDDRIGKYEHYPWARFTLFDDRSVSFILTPNTSGGQFTYKYYSEDPMIVDMFVRIFAEFEENAKSARHVFTSRADALAYIGSAQPLDRIPNCA